MAAWYRDRAVAGKPAAPIVIAGAELLLDEETAEARAVDEEITGEGRSIHQRHAFHMPPLAVDRHVDDHTLDAAHPVPLGIGAQEARIEAGVEVEGIRELRQRQARIRRGPR